MARDHHVRPVPLRLPRSSQSRGWRARTGTRKTKSPKLAEPLCVVGIGASASGLEAFRELLEHLPADTGLAIVLVQHLDPTHASLLAELLAKAATIPVHEARNGTRLGANCAYVIPPNTSMTVADGALTLVPRPKEKRLHLPIDDFLRSLAAAKGSSAIGVILSGTASAVLSVWRRSRPTAKPFLLSNVSGIAGGNQGPAILRHRSAAMGYSGTSLLARGDSSLQYGAR